MFEIGNSLREARDRRGIGLPEAEVATKIRTKYLRALEDEHFSILPAETYVRGFLRTYAEYLGLDGQLYVDEYTSRFVGGDDEGRIRRVPARQERHQRRTASWLVLGTLAAIAGITVVVISAWTSSGGSTNASQSPTAVPPAKRVRQVAPALLTVTAIRSGTQVTVRRGSATGEPAFVGTVLPNHPVSIRGTRLWVQITSPENVKVLVLGRRVVVPGGQPRVGVVTRTGWHAE